MAMKKIFILTIAILFVCCTYSAKGQLKPANKLYSQLKYNQAIPYFLKVVNGKKDENKKEATWKLAECYRLTNNLQEANVWFEEAFKFQNLPTELFLHYGTVLRNLGQYNDAKVQFETYLKSNPNNEAAEKYLQFCEEIIAWKNLDASSVIENDTTLNSRFSDFSPVHFTKGLVFISDRDYDMLDNNNYLWTGNGYLNLYWQENKTVVPVKMSKDYNQAYHDGPVCFTNNNTQLFTTRTLKTKWKRKDTVQTHYAGIYMAKLNAEKVVFKPFGYNNVAYSVAHPAVSENGKKMIFSSNMPGGKGKSDLYFSEQINGEWTTPKNLGELINTFGNEYFPYLADETTLYFSSDGQMGYGGLDIYVSKYKNGEWGKPINLKAPINSSYDDFGILLSDDKTAGYFSSNRPGGLGEDDIYKFWDFKFIDNP
jgi:tetratricopeptide (TPR) repeat protein